MLDFDCATSLNQDVLQYMTDNKMYAMMSSSNDENIEFAIQRVGRLMTLANQKEATLKAKASKRRVIIDFDSSDDDYY